MSSRSFKTNFTRWIKSEVLTEARKYSSRVQFMNLSRRPYFAAIANGWIKESTAHMLPYWTKERVLCDAKKYESRTQWAKASPTACKVARKNGWVEECSKHMAKKAS